MQRQYIILHCVYGPFVTPSCCITYVALYHVYNYNYSFHKILFFEEYGLEHEKKDNF
jgi:hypothetical protein